MSYSYLSISLTFNRTLMNGTNRFHLQHIRNEKLGEIQDRIGSKPPKMNLISIVAKNQITGIVKQRLPS